MRLLALCFLWLLGMSAPAQAATVALSESDGALILTLPSDAPAGVITLDSPPRIAIDYPAATLPTLQVPSALPEPVSKLRSGQFNATTVRLVMELTDNYAASHTQDGATLTLRLTKRAKGFAVKKEAEKKKPEPVKKHVVVIDAGHGGQDPGATGEGGTREKDVVLKYALELARVLEESGNYDAVLTRKSDVFIPLRERVAIARRAKGEVFISLHADSAEDKVRGLSVYTLSETASDKEAEALAARENKSDIIAGLNLETHDEDVANILISLAQRETNTHSAGLADALVVGMQTQHITLLENTHRFAGFAVLKAPDVPSVLVETGFLSHPEEEKKLNDAAHRQRIILGLKAGLDTHFERLKRLEKKLP